ncbi:FAD-dependent oxidoreductase, partial [Proteus mirabilis]|uniref:FAD-dependent oxidoreductase n=2 Tax=Pseudomonadota TaxID=1224 RepID=UPI0013D87088
QMTDPFDVLLRSHSLRQFREWEAEGLDFHHIGYLRLARTEEQMKLFAKSVEYQREMGFKASVYDSKDLQKLVPHLDSTGLAGGIFGP